MKELLKSEIFDIYSIVRELWNDYYNGKEVYSNDDLARIQTLMFALKNDITEIEYYVDIMKEV